MKSFHKPLHIAIVSDVIYPYHKGGKEVRIHHLSRQLAAMGHEVHIYTMQWWEGDQDRVEDGVHLHAISRHYPLYVDQRRSIKQGIMFGLACLKLLFVKFDLLEVDHIPYFPLYAGKIVSLIRRRPLYATWHEVWGRQYWQQYLGPLGLIAYFIERLSLYLPDHFIAASDLTAQRLTQLIGSRRPISTVGNGIDLRAIQAVPPATETSDVIFAGRLLPHKHADLLIQAVAQLKATHPHIRCLIIGSGPEQVRLQQLIGQLDLKANVLLKGSIESHQEVFALMKSSRVFVLPSFREGFGIVAIEAAACGLPLVTVDHPDNAARLLITPKSGLVAPPTATGLAAAITQVLGSSAFSPESVATAYDWQRSAQQLTKAYPA